MSSQPIQVHASESLQTENETDASDEEDTDSLETEANNSKVQQLQWNKNSFIEPLQLSV